MKLDDKALRGLAWLTVGAVIVAVAWIISASNPEVGNFIPGTVSVTYFFAVVGWWANWYNRVDNRRRAVAIQQQEAFYRATGLDQIDVMTGVEFENYVATVLRGLGYDVSLTRATGDFGVDLIATKDGVRTAVQCKRRGTPVGGAAVQQVVAGAAMHNCTATMVVCNCTFTRAAQQLASMHGCQLIDRSGLEALVRVSR